MIVRLVASLLLICEDVVIGGSVAEWLERRI